MKIFLCSLLLSFALNAETLMVSHKGIWKNHIYPQNSLSALQKAIDVGFKGIEFDIFLSKDNKFILAHDDQISKISNCKGKISSKTKEELERCQITKNTTLPITQLLLKKVKKKQPFVSLSTVKQKLFSHKSLEFIWIDLKPKNLNVVTPMVEFLTTISDQSILNKIVINSTSTKVLLKLKEAYPNMKYSLEGKWGSEPLTDYKKYLDNIGITHDYVSLNLGLYFGHEPAWKLIKRKKRFWRYLEKYLEQSKSRGIKSIGWTVNNKKKIKKLKSKDIDFLLTDRIKP